MTSTPTRVVAIAPTVQRSRAGAVRAWVGGRRRENPWIFWVFCLGALVRLVAMVAYSPALLFNGDSYSYLSNSRNLTPDLWHPLVYPFFLHLLSYAQSLAVVPLVQHMLGLATGVLIYRLLRSFGVGDLGSTLAAMPVLLDAFQVDVEHVILSESLFELMLVGAVYLLLTRRRSILVHGIAGLLLGLATLTRTVAAPAVLAIGLALLVLRVGWKRIAAVVVATAIPLAGYALAFDSKYGRLALTGFSGRQLYGETATFARCKDLPAADQPLCPTVAIKNRAGNNQYTWSPGSPLQTMLAAPEEPTDETAAALTPEQARAAAAAHWIATNLHTDDVANQFAHDVISRQPLDYAEYVAKAVLHYFVPGRQNRPRDYLVAAGQFPARLDPPPPTNIDVSHLGIDNSTIAPHMRKLPAAALRSYQRFAYVPGPLLALAILLGLWGAIRRPRDRRAIIAAAFVLSGVGLLVLPAMGAGFDYRYTIPADLFLPAAGVLGAVLLRERAIERSIARGTHGAPRRSFPARALATLRDDRRMSVAGVGALSLVVLAGNAVGAHMVSVGRERVLASGALGSTLRVAGGTLELTAGRPVLLDSYCSGKPDKAHVGWFISFDMKAHLLHGPVRLVQVIDASVVGDRRTPWYQPAANPLPSGFRDELLTPGASTSGTVRFFIKKLTGQLVFNAEPSGGLAGWKFSLVAPAGTPEPGTPCTPPAPGTPPRPTPAPIPLATAAANGDDS